MARRTYQEIILALEQYWADYGCVLLTPYHTEVAAGAMNPPAPPRSLGPPPGGAAYLAPGLPPLGGPYGENPMRLPHYLPDQGVLKPPPRDRPEHYLPSPPP